MVASLVHETHWIWKKLFTINELTSNYHTLTRIWVTTYDFTKNFSYLKVYKRTGSSNANQPSQSLKNLDYLCDFNSKVNDRIYSQIKFLTTNASLRKIVMLIRSRFIAFCLFASYYCFI